MGLSRVEMPGRWEGWMMHMLMKTCAWSAAHDRGAVRLPGGGAQTAPEGARALIGDEIVVTARKRESLQDVHASVRRSSSWRSSAPVSGISPGSRLPHSRPQAGRRARGRYRAVHPAASAHIQGAGADAAVGIFVDGIYLARHGLGFSICTISRRRGRLGRTGAAFRQERRWRPPSTCLESVASRRASRRPMASTTGSTSRHQLRGPALQGGRRPRRHRSAHAWCSALPRTCAATKGPEPAVCPRAAALAARRDARCQPRRRLYPPPRRRALGRYPRARRQQGSDLSWLRCIPNDRQPARLRTFA